MNSIYLTQLSITLNYFLLLSTSILTFKCFVLHILYLQIFVVVKVAENNNAVAVPTANVVLNYASSQYLSYLIMSSWLFFFFVFFLKRISFFSGSPKSKYFKNNCKPSQTHVINLKIIHANLTAAGSGGFLLKEH